VTSKDRVRTAHRPEYAVLSGAVGLATTADAIDRLRVALAQVTNWSDLLRLAIYHGVFSSFYRRVVDGCPEAVPPEFLAELQKLYQALTWRNLRVTGSLLKLLDLFASHHIPAIAYKGPVLAAMAYGDIALRQFVDLDILVRRKDIEKVRDLLFSKGYRLRYPFTKKQERVHLKRAVEITFMHPQRVLLDIHWRFEPDYLGGGWLDAEAALERSEPVKLEGKTVYTLAAEDMLLLLCQHGTFDLWSRLSRLNDVAHLISAKAPWDWPGILQRSKQLGIHRHVLLGLSLANELLGAAIPMQVLAEVDADFSITALRRQVREDILLREEEPEGFIERTFFYFQIRNRLKDRLTYLWIRLFIPTMEDWRRVPIPDSFYWLYYGLRPLRLVLQGLVLPLLQRFYVLLRMKAGHNHQ
jgi:hypothetical protein